MEVPPLRERLQAQLLVQGLVRKGYCRLVLLPALTGLRKARQDNTVSEDSG